MIRGVVDDVRRGVSRSRISARFHNTLAEVIVAVARRIGEERVVLSGGCFQNAYLTERTISHLRREGFSPCWHQRVPPNDGGIALGQVYAVLRQTADGGYAGNQPARSPHTAARK
jgi:hydrogenase maturation protein HypF